MATKKNQTSTLQNTVIILKEKAVQINEELLIATDELVDGSLTTGAKVQDIMAKVLKNGTFLLGKQQDLAFDTIEALLGQYKSGNVKFRKLLGFDKYTARKVKAKNSIKKAINKKKKQVKAKTSKVKVPTFVATDDTVVATTATPKKRKATKKAIAKKSVSTRRKKTTQSKKVDLTIIEGIGPKIAAILNKAGIKTFDQLAKAELVKVKEILAKAGKRYKAHDPTTWGQQAELAAAGKWEVLQAWKNRLKGGKSNSGKRVVIL